MHSVWAHDFSVTKFMVQPHKRVYCQAMVQLKTHVDNHHHSCLLQHFMHTTTSTSSLVHVVADLNALGVL